MSISEDWAHRVATECKGASEELLALQTAFAETIQDGVQMTPKIVGSLQSLDTVQQTLADLGRIFDTLSDSGEMGDCRAWDAAVATVQQATLRQRLHGSTPVVEQNELDSAQDCGEVDLW